MATESKYIPYGTQWIDENDIEAVVRVLRSGYLTQGPQVSAFERKIADYVDAQWCVAFSSATAALHCAVAALGIAEGGAGVTSTNTFVASANCLAMNRLRPMFADIDPVTFNVTASSIKKVVDPTVKVLIPVHFAGQPCDMSTIASLASEKNIAVIEDAAHAIGSNYPDGSRVGNCKYSDMTVFSFHPVKTITTGEGGAVTTNSRSLYNRLQLLRSHGITKDRDLLRHNPGPWYYEQQALGFNYRITDLQCTLGIRQLEKLEAFKRRRREIIATYNESFSAVEKVKIPNQSTGSDPCFHLYVLQMDFAAMGKSRAEVMEELNQLGVGTQVHYIPVHSQPWYQETYGYRWGDYPLAEAYYERALSLPLYPKMTDTDVNTVIQSVREVVG